MGKINDQKNKIKEKKTIKTFPDVVQDEEENLEMNDAIDVENDLADQNDLDFDKRSVTSNKTIKSLVSKKKDKIKLKRQFLLKRLHTAHESKHEAKERATRRKTVIISDMKHEFENSLGQIESYLEEQRLALAEKKTTRKQILSQAERNRQSQANIDIFNKISQSVECSVNPFELIKRQLEQQIVLSTKKKK
ncbi:unnamed protein product [Rotaria magnacalcarata]|uniref:Uncharacterized protein n=1 Tax=Rotaria magnacalcarata TaxID=392030 RepID=A0A816VKM4_9BILA|nr:unnamed protein product [Rotaria magnacalcarata]CAF2117825.1 unnamed protein product [Rotaria magnacalcarata]CAF2128753.1 unnamed protein product [Rotaria magnacalcarata]CAF3863024.1 unnamed protein product [Rotaria magnacalcarata]CAF4197589.1 unnamed protein product [Rotaria magnacalcarata]